MGATSGPVDIDKFASEVKSVFDKIAAFQPDIVISATAGDGKVYEKYKCA